MERVTTIRADQWELVEEDVKAGRCEVLDFDDDIVVKITPRNYGFNVFNINSNGDSWISDSYSTFTVRWLDTAPAERDAEAMSNHDLKMWALNMENVDDKRVLLAIDRLITENASLQAELEAARKQLAAAVEMATAARKEIAELFDLEQRFDRSKDGRFVTETLNFADASLMLIEGITKGTATPQSAPAGDSSELKELLDAKWEIAGLNEIIDDLRSRIATAAAALKGEGS